MNGDLVKKLQEQDLFPSVSKGELVQRRVVATHQQAIANDATRNSELSRRIVPGTGRRTCYVCNSIVARGTKFLLLQIDSSRSVRDERNRHRWVTDTKHVPICSACLKLASEKANT